MRGPERSGSWALVTLLVFAAVAIAPELFDAEVVKRAATTMLAAVVILPWLAFAGREALRDWFTSGGARLLVLALAIALLVSTAHLGEAAVTDRLLTFGLVNIAAVLGAMAARRDPAALGRALRWAVLPVAVVAWCQALGWERALTPGPEEIVALSGNSTLAGALLALGLLAWVVRLVYGIAGRAGVAAARDRIPWASVLALTLVSGAWMLTRARGARVAAGVTLAVLLVTAGVAAARSARRAREGEADSRGAAFIDAAPRPILRHAVLSLLAGIVLAWFVGGGDTLMAHKLQDDGAILDGRDLTTNVRLALASSTTDMVLASPWTGVGLGRFRAEFPPYRDPLEAALPGLAGAGTEARHPHNEFLLVAAEGGLFAALLVLVFVALTLRRAWRQAAFDTDAGDRGPDVLALLIFLAGVVLALVQDAWTDPATALPVFAAVGFVWSAREGEARRLDPSAASGVPLAKPITVATLLLAVGLALLAWPRLDSHLSLRSFYLRAQEENGIIGPASFPLLLRAAEVGAGDVDLQRMMLFYGTQYAPQAPEVVDKVAAIQAVDLARERLAVLAPHAD